MSSRDRYDVIIIGTGAGGGTLARALAPTGLRVLLLERGEFLPRERENWDEQAVFAEGRYLARETWFDKDDKPFQPYTHYWVGGNTKVYGAALLRMREHDFGEVRHYGGLSPAWPIGYGDLEPHYTRAERLHSVHGKRGLDPHDPAASAPYPAPPLPHEARIQELFDDLAALGLRPFPVPLGVRLSGYHARVPETRLSNFDGYPDLTEVKADADVVGVRPALDSPNVTLLTGAYAERLITSPSGREVTGVGVVRGPERFTLHAGVVVVACGAINSAALFLRSVSDAHPRGLANSTGLVGRNYMCHHNGVLLMVSRTPNPSQFQKTFAITDFYRGDAAADRPDMPLGTAQLMGKPDLGMIRRLAKDALPGRTPADIRAHSVDFFLTAEDLPSADNRVTLREDGSIKVSYAPNNVRAYELLEARMKGLLSVVDRGRGRGAPSFLSLRLGVAGVSHQSGTLRFGADPRTSVLDPDCKAHDLDNLYVADSSFFPSSSAVNPSLTIMANALRVGERIASRLGASAVRTPRAAGVSRGLAEAHR